jgi:hypothetical protein
MRPGSAAILAAMLESCTGRQDDTIGEMLAAACARRSSVGLILQSLVNQALRGLEPPLLVEPGASAPGGGRLRMTSPAVSGRLRSQKRSQPIENRYNWGNVTHILI